MKRENVPLLANIVFYLLYNFFFKRLVWKSYGEGNIFHSVWKYAVQRCPKRQCRQSLWQLLAGNSKMTKKTESEMLLMNVFLCRRWSELLTSNEGYGVGRPMKCTDTLSTLRWIEWTRNELNSGSVTKPLSALTIGRENRPLSLRSTTNWSGVFTNFPNSR